MVCILVTRHHHVLTYIYFLHLHYENYHSAAEWNIFAILHGKSPYNGNDGTVTQIVACTSLKGNDIQQQSMYTDEPENILQELYSFK